MHTMPLEPLSFDFLNLQTSVISNELLRSDVEIDIKKCKMFGNIFFPDVM
jgi:hypothetical protein